MSTIEIERRTKARFLARCRPEQRGYATECWVWKSTMGANGYGRFQITRKPFIKESIAHRASYMIFKGPIPEGMDIDHVCRNRDCVNPGHLRILSHRENVLSGRTFAANNRAKTHCPSGHEYSTENTYLFRGMRMCKECRRAIKRKTPHVHLSQM
jgi:hypothetical protein